ncbi:unnamed protein product [Malus baccata var. baccata]
MRGRRTGRCQARRMHRCRTSTICHTALRLSGERFLPGLSLGPARAPSPAHARPPSLGYLALFESQSIELLPTVELL